MPGVQEQPDTHILGKTTSRHLSLGVRNKLAWWKVDGGYNEPANSCSSGCRPGLLGGREINELTQTACQLGLNSA